MATMLQQIQKLWSPNALMIYAGAAMGFYGSRALHKFAMTPLVDMLRGDKEAVGMLNPANWKEFTDIATALILGAVFTDTQIRTGILAGAGLSLTDHLLDRFPAVAANIPR